MGHADTHRRLHQLAVGKRFAELGGYLREDFSYEDTARGVTTKTVTEFTDWLSGWFTSFSDARPDEGTYWEGPDFSCSVFHARGTNDGPVGPFPATGRSMDVPFCEVLHYDAEGRGLSGMGFYDQLTMLTQLGLVPPPAEAPVSGALEGVVREMFAAFERKDLAAAAALTTDDSQGVDEISRRWMRGRESLEEYFRELEPNISDISSEMSDVQEKVYGDTGIVTFWLEQDYTLGGQPQHVSAPSTVVLRREDGRWRIALFHSIPLTDAA